MEVSKKMIEEMKKLYQEKEGKEISDQEAYEAAYNLTNYVELVWEISMREAKKKARLKKEPGGFAVDGNYSCSVCRNSIDETNGWYDWYGQTCLTCRKAILDDTIPPFVAWHRDSYFLMWQLKSSFDIHPQTARKYVREGKLVARVIKTDDGKVYEHVFLKKENPGLIERYSPERKSYDRHRAKESARWEREQKAELRKEMRERMKKYKYLRKSLN